MTFVSIPFAVLFIVTAILVKIFKERKHRHIVLLFASYVFYAWWDIRFLFLLISQTFVAYAFARMIEKDEKRKKMYMIMGAIIPLAVLGFFKYFNFFRSTITEALNLRASDALNIILPIGISFYTFQAISYLIDVYRGKLNARDSFVEVSLYISFFPQLVAGPIVRASEFLPQLDVNHEITCANVEEGIQIFLTGMFKKTVIADRLAVCVDAVYAAPTAYDAPSIIMAAISYSMQIYCDFSGYSDMAIGVAKFFGYDLCKNFDLPYQAKNPTEFWKRWHISLSSWLQDYLYISLGGNRKGRIRTYINLMLTMLLGGLWHGADWSFVAWGGIHGLGLVVHKLTFGRKKRKTSGLKEHHEPIVLTLACMLLNSAFATLCWIFFRAQSISDAIIVFKRIFTWSGGVHYIFVYTIIYGVLLLAVHMIMYFKNNGHAFAIRLPLDKWIGRFLIILEIFIIMVFAYGGDTAFVYFQF